MDKQTVRIRRVGSITFGAVLVATGLIFLVHLFFPAWNLFLVYRFWPVMLIMLGIEVLVGSRQKTYVIVDEKGKIEEQSKVVYDVPAILLTIVLTGFSMCMGLIDWAFQTQNWIYI